ncbi:MAG: DUF58 domain-containing protein [Gemmatimonadaceae bacterium]
MTSAPAAAGYGALLDALRGVGWPARLAVRGSTPGTHRSRLVGVSPEFTEYRPYRQGDDPRRLDWKLLARTDRAYLRITNDRATLGTTIIVDASVSMAFPSDTWGKWVLARELAVGLAAVAHAGGDPVGATAVVDARRVGLPPRTRRGVIGEIGRLLDGVRPAGQAPLAQAIAAAYRTPRMAIVSDLLGDADAMLIAARAHVIAGGEVHVIHVVAREEADPPAAAILARDPEHDDIRRPLVDATRAEYLAAFSAWRSEQARAWRAAAANYTAVVTGEAAAHAVRRVTEPPTAERSAR